MIKLFQSSPYTTFQNLVRPHYVHNSISKETFYSNHKSQKNP